MKFLQKEMPHIISKEQLKILRVEESRIAELRHISESGTAGRGASESYLRYTL
jgi:hypothetical protein